MTKQTFSLGGGQQVTVDLERREVRWEDWRPGNEGAVDQPLDVFLERGPANGAELPRELAGEMLAFAGREHAPWCELQATLSIQVGGTPLRFWAYPPPSVHGPGFEAAIARVVSPPEVFFARFAVASAVLAEDSEVDGVALAAGTVAGFLPNGRLHFGTPSRDGEVGGRKFTAGRLAWFEP